MTDDLILDRVHAIVTGIAGPGRLPENHTPDTPLGDDGYWLDSTDMLEVVLACEREFGIVFEPGADLTIGTMTSARDLARVISERISS